VKQLIAHHPALKHDAPASIDTVQLKDVLGDVDAERVGPRRGHS
jgi:hypothetical protein